FNLCIFCTSSIPIREGGGNAERLRDGAAAHADALVTEQTVYGSLARAGPTRAVVCLALPVGGCLLTGDGADLGIDIGGDSLGLFEHERGGQRFPRIIEGKAVYVFSGSQVIFDLRDALIRLPPCSGFAVAFGLGFQMPLTAFGPCREEIV